MKSTLNTVFAVLLISTSSATLSCCNSIHPDKPAKLPVGLQLDPKALSFKHPGTGHDFTLHLGEELHQETGGITSVPQNINAGSRDATSSYYEPTDENGGSYVCAESIYSRNTGSIAALNTTIQYQADSGRLLITEDKSDGLPCRRYILFTRGEHGGYDVRYLSPPYKPDFAGLGLPSGPPDITLMSGDCAEIDGHIYKIKAIAQSPSPFSLGG